MNNVYSDIKEFYSEAIDFDYVISQDVIERYLRQKAWNGYPDDELRSIWSVLGWFMNYLIYRDVDNINELTAKEHVKAIVWIADNNIAFQLNENNVRAFLNTLDDFYHYLELKKILSNAAIKISSIEDLFQKGDCFVIPELVEDEACIFHDNFHEDELVIPVVKEKLNYLIENLLNKIGGYFKQKEFSNDFNRAISLYSGPFNAIPESDGEEFWLGFWDYFLFDYHLLKSDEIPLKYFYSEKKKNLSVDEIHILNDLFKAEFTVFYIDRIRNESVVECVNLISNEKFELPVPDYGVNDYKNVILYGHIYSQGVVMLNYITSIPMSEKFRKRIREEIIRQKDIYKIQNPTADIHEFFERHAVTVRHTVDILLALAKVNVTSDKFFEIQFPNVLCHQEINDDVKSKLVKLAENYRMGKNAIDLLLRIWYDYANLADKKTIEVSSSMLAAAIILSFAEINGMHTIRKRDVFKRLKIVEDEYGIQKKSVFDTLNLQMFDPRYLTEEGFVLSLYEF